jgi:endonuclease/exonuclease/phosphatase (EEP) superfamily protein YafD
LSHPQKITLKTIDKKLVSFLLGCIAACSIGGLLSGLHWFFDLFNHFRPQAVIGAVVLLIAALLLKDRKNIILALAVIALNATLMGSRIYAFNKVAIADSASYAGNTVSIISSNVHTENTSYASLVRLVKEQRPDIFVAIEVNATWVKKLEDVEGEYPYTFKYPQEDNFGMAVYSKMPFKGELVKAGLWEIPLLSMQFKSFVLMAMHPLPPMDRDNVAEMSQYFSEFTKRASQTKLPLIVAGDLNTTFWSDNIRPFIFSGLTPANPSGIAWTWPSDNLPFAIQIDHIFVRDATVRSFEVLDDIGSDHYPIKALISFKSPSSLLAPPAK